MKIEIDLEEFANQVKSGKSVTAKGGVLNDLVKQLTEMTLQSELESHLAQDPSRYAVALRNAYTCIVEICR